MPYNLINDQNNGYATYQGDAFTGFDAGQAFLDVLNTHFPGIQFRATVISERKGSGQRREVLYEVTFQNAPASQFYVYCFPTESGGRPDKMPNEARIQWRIHNDWTPDLRNHPKASEFSQQIRTANGNVTNKECYLFAIYKRSLTDTDVAFSALYPTQAGDVETAGVSPKSIQFRYPDIQSAYTNGVSSTEKTNQERVVHFLPQYLIWYMLHRDDLHTQALAQFNAQVAALPPPTPPVPPVPATAPQPATPATPIPLDVPRNKIIYGAPGTGKSFVLREQAGGQGFTDDQIVRVTFHPSYSYQQFVGTYKPVPIYKKPLEADQLFASDRITTLTDHYDAEPLIDYQFVAGPLINQLVNALQQPDQNFLIIIEEINRANVASVFGDVFQLLDRKATGESEYDISFNKDAGNYLTSQNITDLKIKLPANLFIWATMNSADQGVMPLDAAFKRRWSFEYLPLNAKEGVVSERKIKYQGNHYHWNGFRSAINQKLKSIGVAEDKLLGPFFLSEQELTNEQTIKNKLLLYLRDDVVRHQPESLFNEVTTFSDIIQAYDEHKNIFNDVELPMADDENGDLEATNG